MPAEPQIKRAVTFIDGQNLFFAAKSAFGHNHPNYDVKALSEEVCQMNGWRFAGARFYTGVPDRTDNSKWHQFWAAKLLTMSRQGVWTYKRSLRYRNKSFDLPGGSRHTILVAEEKGIDVRIALDVIRLAHRKDYDVAIIFSQDRTFPKPPPKCGSSHKSRIGG